MLVKNSCKEKPAQLFCSQFQRKKIKLLKQCIHAIGIRRQTDMFLQRLATSSALQFSSICPWQLHFCTRILQTPSFGNKLIMIFLSFDLYLYLTKVASVVFT